MNIIEALKDNDQRALTKLYELFHRDIYQFIYLKTKSTLMAQEVTQLTYIKVWKNRQKLNESLKINVQLFGIARQIMIDELRKESTRYKHEGECAQTPFSDNLIKALESKDVIQHLEHEIANMPRVRKLVFGLSRKNGLSHKEIAHMLNMSTKNVEQHISKALAQLKHYLYNVML